MIPRISDRYDEWLRLPVAKTSADPRFEVRRANVSEFESIYHLIDKTNGNARPRALYDWLYRRNPTGTPQCWIVIEKATGQLVSSESRFPWPIARGVEALPAVLRGDSVTTPKWQRQGLYQVRLNVRDSHPWQKTTVEIGTPNAKSIGALTKYGLGGTVMGPLPRAAMPLRASKILANFGCPRLVAAANGVVADSVSGAWHRFFFRRRSKLAVREVRRFDAAFDDVTERCMTSSQFWCPHDSDFLNWRYLDHPTKSYVALALEGEGGLVSYCVVRVDGERALLMEFAAPREPRGVPLAQLFHATEVARLAGCRQFEFFAPPGWPHWKLFRRASFLGWRSRVFFSSRGLHEPAVSQLSNWQLVPGDTDYT